MTDTTVSDVPPRVLVRFTGHESYKESFYSGWRFDCSVCGGCSCDGHRFDQAMEYATHHARTCPALHLAQLKARVAEAVGEIEQAAAVNPSVISRRAYRDAAMFVTAVTGIPAQPATENQR